MSSFGAIAATIRFSCCPALAVHKCASPEFMLPMQAWKMNISPRFVDVDAHVLPAPDLQYKERTQPMNTGSLGAW